MSEDLLGKVRAQLEFYFGDSNLRRDRYLRTRIEANDGGYVKISDLLTFNKLKALTTDVSVVVEACKGSSLLAVNDAADSIKRTSPLPKQDQPVDVSVFVSGLPFAVSIDDIVEAFKAVEGLEPLLVQIRKESNAFNGEAFIEFPNSSQVQTCVEKAPSQLKFRQVDSLPDLKIIPMIEWMQKYRKFEANVKKGDAEKAHSADAAQASEEGSSTSPAKKTKNDVVKGSLVKVEGIEGECTRESLREAINARVTFVDYDRGQPSGIVRFASADDALKGIEILQNLPSSLAFKIGACRVMSDDETDSYSKLIEERRQARAQKDASGKDDKGNKNFKGERRRNDNSRGGRDNSHRGGKGRSDDRRGSNRDSNNNSKRNRDGNDRGSKKAKEDQSAA